MANAWRRERPSTLLSLQKLCLFFPILLLLLLIVVVQKSNPNLTQSLSLQNLTPSSPIQPFDCHKCPQASPVFASLVEGVKYPFLYSLSDLGNLPEKPHKNIARMLKGKPFRKPDVSVTIQVFLEKMKARGRAGIIVVGANVGMAAFAASAMWFRVLAFEPVFENLQRICEGIFFNRAESLVTVFAAAASDRLWNITFHKLAEIENQGKLVSDEIIISLLSKRLESGGAKGESGFILDGFPRTIRQAEILEGVTEIDMVVNLKLREDVPVEKCLGRRICSKCGGNFNVANISIKGENGRPGIYMAPLLPPAHFASKLITRSDDTEAVVKELLRIYNDMCQSVEEFYRSRGKLLEFDLPGGIPESWPKLLHALNLEDHDDKQSAAA